MTRIHISASREYDVEIGRGLIHQLVDRAGDLLRGQHVVVVSDSNVAPLHLEAVLCSFKRAGWQTDSFVFPAGEESKCGQTYLELLNFLAQKKLGRSDALIALGGGVVGDLTGFAAATYLRGIDYIQIPTTLLACVDSSVGGKTAIDLAAGKNLAGAFYQPRLVLCDPELLNTLPSTVFSDGCAEVIKYGMLGSSELLDRLQSIHASQQLEYVIAKCVDMKREIVESDEFDTGRRQLLNLGHTFGHAIEAASAFSIPHGRAVAMGMRLITRAAVEMHLCPQSCLDILETLLQKYDLPLRTEFKADVLIQNALSDKKRQGKTLTLAVPCGYGESRLLPISVDKLSDWARAGLEP